jgi:hypothetical protein
MRMTIPAVCLLVAMPIGCARAAEPHPLFRDFMGLNVHTVLVKPNVYKPVCRQLRGYHSLDWNIFKGLESLFDVINVHTYAERLPLKEAKPEHVEVAATNGAIRVTVSESPAYLWFRAP